MKVSTILFILWFIVFAYWLAGQFTRYNRNRDAELKKKLRND